MGLLECNGGGQQTFGFVRRCTIPLDFLASALAYKCQTRWQHNKVCNYESFNIPIVAAMATLLFNLKKE